MARDRRFFSNGDHVYGEWHRVELPTLYDRVGHRRDLADRDWTEFCFYGKEPLALYETVYNYGQDLLDKATTYTRLQAERMDIPAYLVAYRTERPPAADREIEELSRHAWDVASRYPIVEFVVRSVNPSKPRLVHLSPGEWADELRMLHQRHYETCPRAGRMADRNPGVLEETNGHPLHQPRLFLPG